MSIPGLHYGQGGDWAVAFWVKPLLDNGTSFDYALSHTGARDAEPAFDPNEVGGQRLGRAVVADGRAGAPASRSPLPLAPTAIAPASNPSNAQVAIFLPEQGHPDTGMVRAIVRDATDVRTNGSLPFFLDSNGCVSDPDCPNKPAEVLVRACGEVARGKPDGQWCGRDGPCLGEGALFSSPDPPPCAATCRAWTPAGTCWA